MGHLQIFYWRNGGVLCPFSLLGFVKLELFSLDVNHQIQGVRTFPPTLWVVFALDGVLWCTKLKNFYTIQLMYFYFCCLCFWCNREIITESSEDLPVFL